MKQLGLGYLQYVQDYDETCPNGGSSYATGCGWAGQLYPYVKSIRVYVCPSDTSTAPPICSYGYNANCVVRGAVNPAVSPGPGYFPVGLALSTFLAPAKSVLLFEVQNNGGTTGTNYSLSAPMYQAGSDIFPGNGAYLGSSPTGYGHPEGSSSGELNGNGAGTNPLQYATGFMSWSNDSLTYFASATGRHSNGANFVLADGHAKWLMPTQVVAGNDQSSSTYCGPTQPTYWAAAATSCSAWAATFSTI